MSLPGTRADITAAGGAGELKRSNPSPLLGAANVGESSLLHWELPGEAQLVLCSFQLVRDGERETALDLAHALAATEIYLLTTYGLAIG